MVIEDDLTKVHAFSAVGIVELEAHLLGVTMNVGEVDGVPVVHAELELHMADLVPSTD